MKLSIIVPVYKVEAYLDACLESIIRQAVDDCEIILVEDGSPDRCAQICDRWAQKHHFIHVVHLPENHGLSIARNTGIEKASGRYITFIDSDDYIAPDTLKANLELLEKHPETDIVEYPVLVNHGMKNAYLFTPGYERTTDYTGWIQQKGYIHCYAWNKIYRRSLWEKRRFPEGRLFEDVFTIPYVMQQASHILQSDKGLYYYCSRNGSISSRPTPKGTKELLLANIQLYEDLTNNPCIRDKDLDELYLRLCDRQIELLTFEKKQYIPHRKIPLGRALLTPRPLNYRLKAILMFLTGQHYCGLMNRIRKILKK